MNMNYDVRVNAIFRNQPSYTYFNKSMEDTQDNFFLSLHEVDSHFMQPQQLADTRAFQTRSLHDPRTQKEVTKTLYDYTRPMITSLFHSPKWSDLNVAQHAIGVRIVKARQEGSVLAEDDFYIWYKMEAIRQKESQEFQKFVFDFSQTNKEQMYMPARRLMDLYKMWYERKAKMLLQKYPSESYNTHLGLPHLRVCKEVLKEQWADIVDVEIVGEKDNSTMSESLDKKLDFQPLHRSLTNCVEEYINSEELKENLEDAAKSKFMKILEEESSDYPQYFIPLESLMFILTAGEYIDLSSEMLVDIKERPNDPDGEKYIIMDIPLPSRQMGWHTYKQVMEQGAVAFLTLSPQPEKEEQIPETTKDTKQPDTSFPAQTLEEFMSAYCIKPPKNCKFGQTLSKWQLKAKDKETIKQIYTITNTPPPDLKPFSIKLEHKPQFGCESMSKYELLREWFKLKMQKETKSTCYRLDINSYQTLLEESQSLQKLEVQLSTVYHISLNQLLSNLYEFLTLLTSMPCGHYMLRYNPKFKDKLMLCKPSEEITQSTVHIHHLLKTEPSELLFMAQQSYLPIVDDLCSLMHVEHKILPCTFRPTSDVSVEINKDATKKPYVVLNDKEWIVARYKNQKKMANNNKTHTWKSSKMNKKKAQRIRRAKRLANQQPNEAQEHEELQREIELDQKIFGGN